MISVVVPAKNAAGTIGKQLSALGAQRFAGDWEVVVADNGSTDGTRDAAVRWKQRLPALHVVDASARPGAAAARNIAVDSARGDRLLFCDADDVATPSWVLAHARALDLVDFATGPTRVFRDEEEPEWDQPSSAAKPPTHMGFLGYALGANMAVSREAFESVGGFSEELPNGQDVDLSWRLQLAGYKLHFVAAAKVLKRSRSSSMALLRQYYRYGLMDPLLYRRFRHSGIPVANPRSIARAYGGSLLRLPVLHRDPVRERWLKVVGRRTGRLMGSVRYRAFYP